MFKTGQLSVFCRLLQKDNSAKIGIKGKNSRELQWRHSNVRLIFRMPTANRFVIDSFFYPLVSSTAVAVPQLKGKPIMIENLMLFLLCFLVINLLIRAL